MGRDYNLTVREAAETVRDIGMSALEEKWEGSQYWRGLYEEAVMMLHSALKTKGLPEPPSHYRPDRRHSQGRRHTAWCMTETANRSGYGRRMADYYLNREKYNDYDPQQPFSE